MPWGLQRKCKFCVSRAISEYWQAGGIDGGESYCSRSGMSARIESSQDVLAENHLPALPISPAGAANPFIQSLTTCRQGLTRNGQSQGLSRQYPSACPASSSGLFCLSASCQRPPVTLRGRSP